MEITDESGFEWYANQDIYLFRTRDSGPMASFFIKSIVASSLIDYDIEIWFFILPAVSNLTLPNPLTEATRVSIWLDFSINIDC